ncbi:MAG: hypothetical protein PT936_00215 [Treponema sp.]|nr:hypothetical protein [Treponema sp.]
MFSINSKRASSNSIPKIKQFSGSLLASSFKPYSRTGEKHKINVPGSKERFSILDRIALDGLYFE